MKTFLGENLQMARISLRLSVKDLSEKVGCTRQAIYNYENSARVPDFNILLRLSKILDKPHLYFFKELNKDFNKNVSTSFFCYKK
tara:strand:- start:995 stop:1249 length:255 start_codon:yes stop_codon:yes gene_type:complete